MAETMIGRPVPRIDAAGIPHAVLVVLRANDCLRHDVGRRFAGGVHGGEDRVEEILRRQVRDPGIVDAPHGSVRRRAVREGAMRHVRVGGG